MSDLRFNTIAGTGLAACLAVLALGALSDVVFHAEYPEEPAYRVAIAEAAPAATEAAAEETLPDFGALFADEAQLASLVTAGEKAHRVCTSCHAFEQGGANGTGPLLWGVFGRTAGGHPGFKYSDAMTAYGQPWSYDNLYAFLESPARYIPGTSMAFAGVKRSQDRVALVAYLRSLSDAPAPLPPPRPPTAEAQPAEGGPAEAAAPGVIPNAPGLIESETGQTGGPVAPSAPPAG